MTDAWRKAALFAAGLLVGGAAAVWAYNTWVAPDVDAARPEVAVLVPSSDGAPADNAVAALPSQAPGPAPAAVAATTSCPAEPLLTRTANGDGQFSLAAAQSTRSGSEPAVFLKVAGEMAGQGRVRDAEVAYIVACQVAAQAAGAPSAPVADVQVQLAQHYAALASQPAHAEQRPQLLARAEELLQDGVRAYTAALGRNASKTRLASRRLESLGQDNETVIAGGTQDSSVLGAAPATAGPAAAGDTCTGARSASERLVCSDDDLSELELDLDRLRAQARAVTRDPGGFAQRQEAAWARRESQCKGDKACLRTWYAQRKKELLSEF